MRTHGDDPYRARIVVTLPVRPCRFEEALAGINDSGVLIETSEAFLHLSRRASRRFVIASPFIDNTGMEWALSLFEATAAPERVLICRQYAQIAALPLEYEQKLVSLGVKLYEYVLVHEENGQTRRMETFHAKIVLADQVAAYVGSANLLRTSKEFSLECGVLLEGRPVRQVYDVIECMLRIAAPKR